MAEILWNCAATICTVLTDHCLQGWPYLWLSMTTRRGPRMTSASGRGSGSRSSTARKCENICMTAWGVVGFTFTPGFCLAVAVYTNSGWDLTDVTWPLFNCSSWIWCECCEFEPKDSKSKLVKHIMMLIGSRLEQVYVNGPILSHKLYSTMLKFPGTKKHTQHSVWRPRLVLSFLLEAI